MKFSIQGVGWLRLQVMDATLKQELRYGQAFGDAKKVSNTKV
jgi:hypothetical protein